MVPAGISSPSDPNPDAAIEADRNVGFIYDAVVAYEALTLCTTVPSMFSTATYDAVLAYDADIDDVM